MDGTVTPNGTTQLPSFLSLLDQSREERKNVKKPEAIAGLSWLSMYSASLRGQVVIYSRSAADRQMRAVTYVRV
jgi:hypothetical protein